MSRWVIYGTIYVIVEVNFAVNFDLIFFVSWLEFGIVMYIVKCKSEIILDVKKY